MEERDLSKCCQLQYQTQYTQQVIINGVPQNSGEVQVPLLACPNCGHIVAQFNPGTSMEQVFIACENDIPSQIKYCINCGQKLSYPSIITVDPSDITQEG